MEPSQQTQQKPIKKALFTDHAFTRLDERCISEFTVKLCYTFGKKIGHYQRVLNFDDIPKKLRDRLPAKVRNRIEHQLPIVGCFEDCLDSDHFRVITAYRYSGHRINFKRVRSNFLDKNSIDHHSYKSRHK